jgi:cell division protein FtsQ
MERLSRRNRASVASRGPARPSALRLWLRRRRGLLRPAAVTLLGLAVLGSAGVALVAADPAGRIGAVLDGAADLGARAGLTVREVLLEGHANAPLDLVREAVGVRRGDPILGFDPHAARERLEMIAWVERAHVERYLNGRIRVRLEERRPFAFWQHNRRIAVIDREGKVIATENIGQFGRLPLVVGAGAERVAGAMIDLVRGAPEVMERTHALVRVSERRWNLLLRNGTEVLLPEGHEAAALARLTELQARQTLMDRPLVAIDLRQPDKLVLRLPPGAAPETPPPGVPRTRSGRG